MAGTTCPRCTEPVPDGGTLNFCTACGYDLRAGAGTRSGSALPLPPPVVRLVRCPHCGASNAASRDTCGRCHEALDPDAHPAPPVEPPPSRPPVGPEPEPESSRLLLVVTTVAGFVIVTVVLTLLGARGVGLLPPPPEGPESVDGTEGFVQLPVAAVSASSTLPAAGEVTYEEANLVDGRVETAWHEGARGAEGEYVELHLTEEAPVARVLVWNGYQKGDQFERNGRVRTLLIEAGDRRFTVDLLNVRGSQAVDLPEPVRTRVVRLQIEAIYEGARYPDTALSEVQIFRRA